VPTPLSDHFTLEEMTTTQQRGLDNTPSEEVKEKLQDLCEDLLEPVRELVGPLHINSGYRSVEVNHAVGGQPTSQHCKGEAADTLPKEKTLQEAAQAILDSDLPYDQMIYEFGSWIHLSYTKDREPRGQALMIGRWTAGKYVVLDLSKVP